MWLYVIAGIGSIFAWSTAKDAMTTSVTDSSQRYGGLSLHFWVGMIVAYFAIVKARAL